MATVARVRLREFANIEVTSGESLPGQNYDVIICSSVIEYVVRDAELLGHFADVLKPSGILLITFPNRRGLLQSITWMFSKRSEYLQYRSRTYTTSEVRKLMAVRFVDMDEVVFSSAGMMVESYKLILLPVWLTYYQRHNKKYNVFINGQTGRIKGATPRSKVRGWWDEFWGNE